MIPPITTTGVTVITEVAIGTAKEDILEKFNSYGEIYLSIFMCSITNHRAQQREKKQWNGKDKVNSSTAALRNRTRCSAIAERPRCRVRYSFRRK